jgi:hypothetical protein
VVDQIQSGLSTIDASGVRSAVGLASANLDTQLGDIPTLAEFEARSIVAANYATSSALSTVEGKIDTIDNFIDTEIAAIKTKTDQLTFTTPNKVDSTAELDSATRVKLDATQPDYAPATAAALATQATKINKIEAVATGTVTGAGTSTEVFVGPSATLTITVDESGNRSAVVVT